MKWNPVMTKWIIQLIFVLWYRVYVITSAEGNYDETDEAPDLKEEYLAEARAYINENGVSGIDEFLRKKLEGWKEVKIRFAVTGDSGSGKSAFINAIRGLNADDYDKGAAKVDVTEATAEPTEYQHPDNPMISFVDLPGIGTPNFPDLPTYSEKVGLENYDTFLIFTAARFTKNDLEIANKVKNIGKSFFLIRTKIDVDLMPKKGKSPINEAAMLQKIRSNCMYNVRDLISSEKEIFLISNYDKDKWDFDRLIVAIIDALPIRQRESLIFSLSNVTRECIKRKAQFLKVSAVAVAAVSAATDAIPLPIVGSAIDAALIAGTCTYYYRQFGLHKIRLAEIPSLDKKYWEIGKQLFIDSTGEFFSLLKTKTSGSTHGGDDDVYKFFPNIEMFGMAKSFASTLNYLTSFVDECEDAAIAVWDKTAKQSI